MPELLRQILPAVIQALAPLVLAMVGWACAAAARYINTRVKSEQARAALLHIDNVVLTVASAVEQTTVANAKKAERWDDQLGREVKADALEAVKTSLGAAGQRRVEKAFGFKKDPGSLDAFLGHKLEAAVGQMRRKETEK